SGAAGPRPRLVHHGHRRAHHTLGAAGGAGHRLRPNGAGQGAERGVRGRTPRPPQRADPGRHHRRPELRRRPLGRRAHRDGLRVAGHRALRGDRVDPAGLPGDPGRHHVDRRHLHRGEPRRRRALRRPRSPHPGPVMANDATSTASLRSMALAGSAWRARPRRNGALVAGAIIVTAWVVGALAAPLLAPHSPLDLDVLNRLEPPSLAHPFGTDDAGRDNLSRIIYGARITVPTAFVVVLVATIVGGAVGAAAGYASGRVEDLLMRVTDVGLAFPAFLLAMAVTSALGAGLYRGMVAIVLVSWPETSRLMRGQILSVKENDYVVAARALGVPARRVVWAHVLPNAFPPVVVKATLDVGNAVI